MSYILLLNINKFTQFIIYLTQVNTGDVIASVQAHSDRVGALAALSADLVASADGSPNVNQICVKVWRWKRRTPAVDRCECVREFRGHVSAIRALEPLADGKRLASASMDQKIILWRLQETNSSPTKTLTGHTGGVCALRQLTSRRLASASIDTLVKIWSLDVSGGGARCLGDLRGHTGAVWTVEKMRNSEWLASGSSNLTIRVWQWNDGVCLLVLDDAHSQPIRSLRQCGGDSKNNMLASGSVDRTIRVWRFVETRKCADGECVKKIVGQREGAHSLAFM